MYCDDIDETKEKIADIIAYIDIIGINFIYFIIEYKKKRNSKY